MALRLFLSEMLDLHPFVCLRGAQFAWVSVLLTPFSLHDSDKAGVQYIMHNVGTP